MNRNKDIVGKHMAAIADTVTEDIMAASDEQILAEFKEDGMDASVLASQMRSVALEKIREVKKAQLSAASKANQLASSLTSINARPALEELKRLAMELIHGSSGSELQMAFHNDQELTEADLDTLWNELQEISHRNEDKQED